jgi:hypothetical protein
MSWSVKMEDQESLKARYDPLNHNTRDILAVAFSERRSPQGSLHVCVLTSPFSTGASGLGSGELKPAAFGMLTFGNDRASMTSSEAIIWFSKSKYAVSRVDQLWCNAAAFTAGSVARGAFLSEDRLSPIRRTRTSRQPGSVVPHVDVHLSDFVSRGRSEEHRRRGARSAGVRGFRPHLPAMRLKRIPARPLQTLKTGDLTCHVADVIQRDDR